MHSKRRRLGLRSVRSWPKRLQMEGVRASTVLSLKKTSAALRVSAEPLVRVAYPPVCWSVSGAPANQDPSEVR